MRNTKTVADLSDPKFTLVTDPFEIDHVLENIGSNRDYCIGCMFVEVIDGDYGEIWACERTVPYLSETVYQLN